MDDRSERNLVGVHPDLVRVIRKAQAEELVPEGVSFVVTEGLRTEARQKELIRIGASRTMHSRHLTGHAVDLAVTLNGEVRWDWPLYGRLNTLIQEAAQHEQVPVEWGGTCFGKGFRDGPHFQLPWKEYPL